MKTAKKFAPARNRKSVLSLIQQLVLYIRQLNLQSGIGINNVQQSRGRIGTIATQG